MLAKLGHRVTAVDIEPRFCELLRRRAEREGVEIEVVNADFRWVEEAGEGRFDTVLFFECFHHCADHLRLLRALRGALATGGRIFFGAEPIAPGFPMPWGLRLDGCSLWAIRKNVWMELGFRDDYFREALARTGWLGRKHACADPPWLTVWEAGRREEMALRFAAVEPPMRTQVGQCRNGLVELLGAEGTGLHGPYIPLPSGRYIARLRFRAGWACGGTAVLDVSADNGETRIGSQPFESAGLVASGMVVELPFEAASDLSGVEVRLFCRPGFTGAIEAAEIAPVA
jgi:SAM-dependent methyltransferase